MWALQCQISHCLSAQNSSGTSLVYAGEPETNNPTSCKHPHSAFKYPLHSLHSNREAIQHHTHPISPPRIKYISALHSTYIMAVSPSSHAASSAMLFGSLFYQVQRSSANWFYSEWMPCLYFKDRSFKYLNTAGWTGRQLHNIFKSVITQHPFGTYFSPFPSLNTKSFYLMQFKA